MTGMIIFAEFKSVWKNALSFLATYRHFTSVNQFLVRKNNDDSKMRPF